MKAKKQGVYTRVQELSKENQKRGPKPEILQIEGDWHKAIKKSLAKKKPADGWPK